MTPDSPSAFNLRIGTCYVFPDRLVVARSGHLGGVDLAQEARRMGRSRLVYAVLGAILLFECIISFNSDKVLSAVAGIYGVLLWVQTWSSRNQSSAALIPKKDIQDVRFVRGIKGVRYPCFVVRFREDDGKVRDRLLKLPNPLFGDDKAVQQAKAVLREAGYWEGE